MTGIDEFTAFDSPASNTRKNLFLLEVMIKKVEVDANVLLKTFTFDPENIPLINVLAKVKFSNFYSLDIDSIGYLERGLTVKRNAESVSMTTLGLGEKTPFVCCSSNDRIPPTQGGKSCLFPMSTVQLVNAIQSSPIYVNVFTKDSTAIFLGKTKLLLGSNFVDVVSSSSSCTDLPISAFIKSTLPITNVFGDVSGLVEIYVRLSCFGKSILSDFSFIHSGIDNEMKIRRCRERKKSYTT